MPAPAVAFVRRLTLAVLNAVSLAGARGAPVGTVYAVTLAQGASLHQCDLVIGTLVDIGDLAVVSRAYRITNVGEITLARLKGQM